MEFKRSDFVQVKYHTMDEDLVTQIYWRNALYVTKTENGCVVQYTNGEKQELGCDQKIRKVKING